MAKRNKRINYQERYPKASNDNIKALKKSDYKVKYQQYDLRAERYYMNGFLEEKRQFAAQEEND